MAAIIERKGRFLFVEEPDKGTGLPVINQPAGHVEPGESLFEAVRRFPLDLVAEMGVER